jgi:hypothetical protein
MSYNPYCTCLIYLPDRVCRTCGVFVELLPPYGYLCATAWFSGGIPCRNAKYIGFPVYDGYCLFHEVDTYPGWFREEYR